MNCYCAICLIDGFNSFISALFFHCGPKTINKPTKYWTLTSDLTSVNFSNELVLSWNHLSLSLSLDTYAGWIINIAHSVQCTSHITKLLLLPALICVVHCAHKCNSLNAFYMYIYVQYMLHVPFLLYSVKLNVYLTANKTDVVRTVENWLGGERIQLHSKVMWHSIEMLVNYGL